MGVYECIFVISIPKIEYYAESKSLLRTFVVGIVIQAIMTLFLAHVNMCLFLPVGLTGCKESQFYRLPFRQAVASMY